jgi:hypothetical protein
VTGLTSRSGVENPRLLVMSDRWVLRAAPSQTKGRPMSVLVRKPLCSVFILVAALIAAASAFGAPVKTPPRSDPSYLPIPGCYARGGAVTAPADTSLTVFGGYVDFSPQAVMSAVTDPGNVIAVDGQAINLHRYWAGLTSPSGDVGYPWGDWFFVPIGELAVGQSTTVTWAVPPIGFTFTCTITGA